METARPACRWSPRCASTSSSGSAASTRSRRASRPEGSGGRLVHPRGPTGAVAWQEYGDEITRTGVSSMPAPGRGVVAICGHGAANPVSRGPVRVAPWLRRLGLAAGVRAPGSASGPRPGAQPARLLFREPGDLSAATQPARPGEAEELSPVDLEPEIVEIPSSPRWSCSACDRRRTPRPR